MSINNQSLLRKIPSVDTLLDNKVLKALSKAYGVDYVTTHIRENLQRIRQQIADGAISDIDENSIVGLLKASIADEAEPSLKNVLNLTGTIIHTNLGRAPLPQVAIEAVALAASSTNNLEFDLSSGRRGDRDKHLEKLLCRLTGAEAATVVNNNAAAVLLMLNTLALRKQVPVSRGELIEIGGAFRIPDIMKRAGCKLIEIGTTNRTHATDYIDAITDKTALLLKVHTSNYAIEGFTKSVAETELADIAQQHNIPAAVDLGSGTLVDLRQFGLPYEPTAQDAINQGMDLITFSGDKLLGGPQAGIIIGRKDLIEKIKRNPMKRALRVDKMTIAALSSVLQLYLNPAQLTEHVPVLRQLSRSPEDIASVGKRLLDQLTDNAKTYQLGIQPCESQIGSGALPSKALPSYALTISPIAKKHKGSALKTLNRKLLDLNTPIIGRIHNDAVWLDLRCFEDEQLLITQLASLLQQ